MFYKTPLVVAATALGAVVQAAINPIEIKGKHFFDSVTKEPVCSKLLPLFFHDL